MAFTVKGDLPAIIRNKDEVYKGDLVHYFKVVFTLAENVNHPYHNFRHMTHVLWQCHEACRYYNHRITPLEKRHLLLAALFHDFNHAGLRGNDAANIERAIEALRRHALPCDRKHVAKIGSIIRATEFPYKVPCKELPLLAQILRDADASQALSIAWLQQVVFGLAAEWKVSPRVVLEQEIGFHENLSFCSEWGRVRFPEGDIRKKIAEIKELIEILDAPAF